MSSVTRNQERLGLEVRRSILESVRGLFEPDELDRAVVEEGQVKELQSAKDKTGKAVNLSQLQRDLNSDSGKKLELATKFRHKNNETPLNINEKKYKILAGRIEGTISDPLPDVKKFAGIAYQVVLNKKGITLNTVQKIAFSALVSRCKNKITGSLQVDLIKRQVELDTKFNPNEEHDAAEWAEYSARSEELSNLQKATNQLVADALMDTISEVINALREGDQIFEGESCNFTAAFQTALENELELLKLAEQVTAKMAQPSSVDSTTIRLANLLMIAGGVVALTCILISTPAIPFVLTAFTGITPLVGATLFGMVAALSALALICMAAGALLIYKGTKEQNKVMIGLGVTLLAAGLGIGLVGILSAVSIIPLVGVALTSIVVTAGVVGVGCIGAGQVLVKNAGQNKDELPYDSGAGVVHAVQQGFGRSFSDLGRELSKGGVHAQRQRGSDQHTSSAGMPQSTAPVAVVESQPAAFSGSASSSSPSQTSASYFKGSLVAQAWAKEGVDAQQALSATLPVPEQNSQRSAPSPTS